MESSNLAERLEEFEATIESLRLTEQPATRLVLTPGSDSRPERQARRPLRSARIVTRDDGLRPFKVR